MRDISILLALKSVTIHLEYTCVKEAYEFVNSLARSLREINVKQRKYQGQIDYH